MANILIALLFFTFAVVVSSAKVTGDPQPVCVGPGLQTSVMKCSFGGFHSTEGIKVKWCREGDCGTDNKVIARSYDHLVIGKENTLIIQQNYNESLTGTVLLSEDGEHYNLTSALYINGDRASHSEPELLLNYACYEASSNLFTNTANISIAEKPDSNKTEIIVKKKDGKSIENGDWVEPNTKLNFSVRASEAAPKFWLELYINGSKVAETTEEDNDCLVPRNATLEHVYSVPRCQGSNLSLHVRYGHPRFKEYGEGEKLLLKIIQQGCDCSWKNTCVAVGVVILVVMLILAVVLICCCKKRKLYRTSSQKDSNNGDALDIGLHPLRGLNARIPDHADLPRMYRWCLKIKKWRLSFIIEYVLLALGVLLIIAGVVIATYCIGTECWKWLVFGLLIASISMALLMCDVFLSKLLLDRWLEFCYNPHHPDNLNVQATGNTLTVTWDCVPGATAYIISTSSIAAEDLECPFLPELDETSKRQRAKQKHVLERLLPDTDYNIFVKAQRHMDVQTPPFEGKAFDVTGRTRKEPDPPGNVYIVHPTSNTVNVSWDSVPGATAYHLSAQSSQPNEQRVTDRIQPEGLEVALNGTLNGLSPGVQYSIRVQAERRVGNETFSGTPSEVEYTTGPDPPGNVYIVHRTSNTVNVSWNSVPGATAYHLSAQSSQPNEEPVTYCIQPEGSEPTLNGTLNGLNPGTHYSISVKAERRVGHEKISGTPSEIECTTDNNAAQGFPDVDGEVPDFPVAEDGHEADDNEHDD